MLQREIIHADETSVNMLNPDGGKCKKAWLWCGMSGVGPPLTVFYFAISRSQAIAKELYGNYSGTMIRDAYVGYDQLESEFAACWAHVRRKFFDLFKAGHIKAEEELRIIRNLYKIEAETKLRAEKKNTETALFNERKIARRASVVLVKEFFYLCRKQLKNEIPSSLFSKAINYALTLEKELSLFLTNPKLNIDNNQPKTPSAQLPSDEKTGCSPEMSPAVCIWRLCKAWRQPAKPTTSTSAHGRKTYSLKSVPLPQLK